MAAAKESAPSPPLEALKPRSGVYRDYSGLSDAYDAYDSDLNYSRLSDAYDADLDVPCVCLSHTQFMLFCKTVTPDTGVLVPRTPSKRSAGWIYIYIYMYIYNIYIYIHI